jgi:hypothetical protein
VVVAAVETVVVVLLVGDVGVSLPLQAEASTARIAAALVIAVRVLMTIVL